MGRPHGFDFTNPEEIWNEIRAGCEGGRGMTYQRLDRAGLQWPCPSESHFLTTGRSLYEFNAGTMTGRCRTRELRPSDFLEIAPVDAEMAGVHDGDRVRLVSRYGSATLPIRMSSAMRAGELFATFHMVKTFLNAITSGHVDRAVGTPEYKVTAVKIEKV